MPGNTSSASRSTISSCRDVRVCPSGSYLIRCLSCNPSVSGHSTANRPRKVLNLRTSFPLNTLFSGFPSLQLHRTNLSTDETTFFLSCLQYYNYYVEKRHKQELYLQPIITQTTLLSIYNSSDYGILTVHFGDNIWKIRGAI